MAKFLNLNSRYYVGYHVIKYAQFKQKRNMMKSFTIFLKNVDR